MTGVLLLKEKLKSFYGRNDMFINPAAKFLLAFVTLCLINGNIGYMKSLNSIFIAIILSLICAILPNGATVLCVTLVMAAHLFSLSMELSVVTLLVFLVMYLFYFRFTGKSSVWVVLTVCCFMLKIPYVIPVAAGLLSSAFSIIPVVFGVIIYYIMEFAKEYEKLMAGMEGNDLFDNFLAVVNGIMNKEILLIALSFALTIAIVYVIRRLSIDYAWIYAVVAGALTDFVMLLVGNVIFSTSISFFGILVGLILSVVVGYILNIVFFGVDYTRTERVQYEDDNYYYYVKAVPKYSVTAADVKVKKINTQKKRRPVERDEEDIDLDF
ncbi:MAG: hypothetical protein PUF12_13275 [Thermoflexaceae bacterium]|nr:hypothetical protein [Thermoflexaceae bacterium]